LEKETPTKKRLEGGQEEGKEKKFRVFTRDAKQGRCSHSILERNKAWRGCGISLRNSSDFQSDHPNQRRGHDLNL
jgi:hypothetical protein